MKGAGNMRVAVVMLGRKSGGIENAFAENCRNLSSWGHNVTAIISKGASIRSTLPEGLAVIEITQYGVWDILARIKVWRALRKIRADVAIGHGRRALRFLKWRPKITGGIAVIHNAQSLEDSKAFPFRVCVNSQLIHTSTPSLPYQSIPNSITIESLPSYERPKKSEKETIIFGALGRFSKEKGFHVWIEALALLKETDLMFKAFLAGQGPEEHALRHLIHDRGLSEILTVEPWVEGKAKTAFYHKIDILCVPSLTESFGLVVSEGFAHDLPVIATQTLGPIEIFSGFSAQNTLCPVNNPQALAQTMLRYAQSPSERLLLSSHGKAYVRETLSPEKLRPSWEKLLYKAIPLRARAAFHTHLFSPLGERITPHACLQTKRR